MNAINPLSDLSQALETEVAAARGLAVAVRNASHRHISALLWQPDVVVTSEQAVGNRDEYEVVTAAGATATARIAGRDPGTNLLVMRTDAPLAATTVPRGTARVGSLTLALGADAVAIGTAALIALGDNAPEHDEAYREIGSAAGFYDDYQAGRDPTGISTQDPDLAARFDPVKGGRLLANYLRVLTLEAQTIARACGKSHVHNLEPEDLVALTVEAAAMARVPLAGTSWIPGVNGSV